jgi:hypothetical protein
MERVVDCARGTRYRDSLEPHIARGIASSDRNNIDDGSFGVDVRPHLPQCPAGLGTCGDPVPVIHLCVWLLQRDGVLFRVPWSAVGANLATMVLGLLPIRKAILQSSWPLVASGQL